MLLKTGPISYETFHSEPKSTPRNWSTESESVMNPKASTIAF